MFLYKEVRRKDKTYLAPILKNGKFRKGKWKLIIEKVSTKDKKQVITDTKEQYYIKKDKRITRAPIGLLQTNYIIGIAIVERKQFGTPTLIFRLYINRRPFPAITYHKFLKYDMSEFIRRFAIPNKYGWRTLGDILSALRTNPSLEPVYGIDNRSMQGWKFVTAYNYTTIIVYRKAVIKENGTIKDFNVQY